MKRTDGETCPVHFQTVETHHILHQQSAPKLLIDIIQYHHPFRLLKGASCYFGEV
jgi:hypothetical protein